MTGKAHVPPSKERYYLTHPVVSFRASRADYGALKKVLETSGKSIGQFFREALGTAQRDTREAYKKGRHDGFKKGLERGKELYEVIVPCSRCARWIHVIGKDMKLKVANSILTGKIWLHKSCKWDTWPDDRCFVFDDPPDDAEAQSK